MSNPIRPVVPVNQLPKSKHSTEDPNERRRRQLLLTYGYNTGLEVAERKKSFKDVLHDTLEVSEKGKDLEHQKKK